MSILALGRPPQAENSSNGLLRLVVFSDRIYCERVHDERGVGRAAKSILPLQPVAAGSDEGGLEVSVVLSGFQDDSLSHPVLTATISSC